MSRRPKPNYIRVRLDIVLDVPGERIGPLLDVSQSVALLIGLEQLGVRVRAIKKAHRRLDTCDADGRLV